jgi:homoserine acetyltransferase
MKALHPLERSASNYPTNGTTIQKFSIVYTKTGLQLMKPLSAVFFSSALSGKLPAASQPNQTRSNSK